MTRIHFRLALLGVGALVWALAGCEGFPLPDNSADLLPADVFSPNGNTPGTGAGVPQIGEAVTVRVVSESPIAATIRVRLLVLGLEVRRTDLSVLPFETVPDIGPDLALSLRIEGEYATGAPTPPLALDAGTGFNAGDRVVYVIPDPTDECPDDPAKKLPGLCGCGMADVDTDKDGVPDCIDGCPGDPEKTAPGLCGCGRAEGTCGTEVLFVDQAAGEGARDGSSWTDAFLDLQDALDKANEPGSITTEIRVASGRYTPDRGTADRTATFRLRNGLTVNGGFAGGGYRGELPVPPDTRDPSLYLTVLSGDLLFDDDADGGGDGDNSYHVVTAVDVVGGVLDGFIIERGNASAEISPDSQGGGLRIQGGSPAIANCVFRFNRATVAGGAAHVESSGAFFNACLFVSNQSSSGGALSVLTAKPVLDGCTFDGNSAFFSGGAAILSDSAGRVLNCSVFGNTANRGGGWFVSGGPADFVNCVFSGNRALEEGGGVYVGEPGGGAVVNSTFWANVAGDGDGSGAGGAVYVVGGETPLPLTITNCILWGNEAGVGRALAGPAAATYSCIDDDIAGDGNIFADPLFVDPDGVDGVVGTADDDLRLGVGSPCIDAGNNGAVPADVTTDREGAARIIDDPCVAATGVPAGVAAIVDMGAYEQLSIECSPPAFAASPGAR